MVARFMGKIPLCLRLLITGSVPATGAFLSTTSSSGARRLRGKSVLESRYVVTTLPEDGREARTWHIRVQYGSHAMEKIGLNAAASGSEGDETKHVPGRGTTAGRRHTPRNSIAFRRP